MTKAPPLADTLDADELLRIVRDLVAACAGAGLVLTVEQRPLKPLAMGNYETVVEIRPARRRT